MTASPILSAADEGSPTQDIYRQLRGLIVSGQLGANERLPTVRQMATDLGVAAGTVAKAYKMLEHDGLVVSRTAAGTRVAESAGLLPASVLKHVRDLVAEAASTGAGQDDVIDVLRAVWRAETGLATEGESVSDL
ncbi:GntR family transcriptional regulator [Microbacterium saperdae]|uniref:DNA-binding transcriptional regulator YhcF (GntR family) n=1 Tax=Microbacterium saperdae TaxID=69368 RepID=A0A543BAM6_9MICO|nr:GntR family transcriptional regulator [Microbacterium saperdae]TQL81899.1 DNA-binding transcriptional regulator YhcF (GntR family) [Microbacterium saperdae]GGM35602.1 GntR family transcriptional regulator [Microbacterium saperdae]